MGMQDWLLKVKNIEKEKQSAAENRAAKEIWEKELKKKMAEVFSNFLLGYEGQAACKLLEATGHKLTIVEGKPTPNGYHDGYYLSSSGLVTYGDDPNDERRGNAFFGAPIEWLVNAIWEKEQKEKTEFSSDWTEQEPGNEYRVKLCQNILDDIRSQLDRIAQ